MNPTHAVPGSTTMRAPFAGVGTALVTPFTPAGAVDEAAFRRLVKRQIAAGIHTLVPCGTTGEVPTLSAAEKRRLIEIAVEEAEAEAETEAAAGANGRTRVLAGAGGYNTAEVIHAAKDAHAAGAHGLLSVTPYYNRPTPDGLVAHYRAIADATPLPIVVYNVPGRTGCNIDPATLLRLADLPTIVGVKEASGNISQIAEICARVPRDFLVLSGDDAITLPLMALGGHGIISVASNEVPADMVALVAAAARGDFAAARTIHTALLPLMQVNFCESSPGPVKFAMAELGLFGSVGAHYRLPMVPISAASAALVRRVLEQLPVDILLRAKAEV